MKDAEKVENNVDARRIIAELLNEVGMTAPKFAEAVGINYQRVFDLQRGRVKKFNPGVANLIVARFPQISKAYLFTGEGTLTVAQKPAATQQSAAPAATQPANAAFDQGAMFSRTIALLEQLNERSANLLAFEKELNRRERELDEREQLLNARVADLTRQCAAEAVEKTA